jgi:hypothetical protein
MIRSPIFSLVFLGAIFGMLGTAHAGFTYDWVSPSGGVDVNGVNYHITGSITVDPTGISTTPVALTSAMVQSWQISVLDSTNALLFSLSSPTNFLELTTNGTLTAAPQITTTSIFLPSLSPVFGETVQSIFALDTNSSTINGRVTWNAGLTADSGGSFYDASVEVRTDIGDSGIGGDSSVNANYVIATREPTTAVPEPSTLVMSSILFSIGGVGLVYRRFKRTATAV